MPGKEEQMMETLSQNKMLQQDGTAIVNKKTGYLNENFRLFHLKDKKNQAFDFHYHDFHKLVIPISGNTSYQIEGKVYYLKPFDILLVGRYDIHKPVISPDCTYERIVIWIKNEFMEKQKTKKDDISQCFTKAASQGFSLIRMQPDQQILIQDLLEKLEYSLDSSEFASGLLSTTYFLQLMISVNRIFLTTKCQKDDSILTYDRQMEEVLKYINGNLAENLSNDRLAECFFLNKYHLMHKFKKETGYTLHSYVEQKRLVHAAARIQKGTPVMKAALECGFTEYSTFLRAFRKKYGKSPRDYFQI